jgi:A/G-specific adenine glycosylase
MTRVRSRSIASKLLAWYRANLRDLPWRATRDPYRIWVSEIMLQQTRAEAVIPYYEKFLQRFPTAAALAGARQDEVLAIWAGLGYYTRARNLHRAAAQVAAGFPADYEGIRRLPGVGDYTAGALASIAFGLPYAVVDGNVLRVVARIMNDPADIGSAATRARFRDVAQHWLDRRHPGEFNQALMELGATVCLPRAPRCANCPLAGGCAARREGTVAQLPVKLRKTAPSYLETALVVVTRAGRVLSVRRSASESLMAGFWELPSPDQLRGLRDLRVIGSFRHTITHHHYSISVCTGRVTRAPRGFAWLPAENLHLLAFTTASKKALRLAGIPA